MIYVIDLLLTLKGEEKPRRIDGNSDGSTADHSDVRCTHKPLQMGSQITERLPFEIKACHTDDKGLRGTWQEN